MKMMPFCIATNMMMVEEMIVAISFGICIDCISGCATFSRPNNKPAKKMPIALHPVSYTHLDVYKRQGLARNAADRVADLL